MQASSSSPATLRKRRWTYPTTCLPERLTVHATTAATCAGVGSARRDASGYHFGFKGSPLPIAARFHTTKTQRRPCRHTAKSRDQDS